MESSDDLFGKITMNLVGKYRHFFLSLATDMVVF